jgi:hypothetical protein
MPRFEFKKHGIHRPFAGIDVASLIEVFNEKYPIGARVSDGYDYLISLGFVHPKKRFLPTAKGFGLKAVDVASTTIVYSDGSTGITKKIIINSEFAVGFMNGLLDYLKLVNPTPTHQIDYNVVHDDRAKMN